MKQRSLLAGCALFALAGRLCAIAQTNINPGLPREGFASTNIHAVPAAEPAARPQEFFRAGEVELEIFGSYRVSEHGGLARVFERNARHGKFGAGLGTTAWLSRNFGIGLEAAVPAVDDVSGVLFQKVSVDLSTRLPLGPFAPYALAGLGRDFETWRWSTHAGAGLEWRANRHAGLFADARYIFGSGEADSLMLRSGVRFGF